MKLGLGLSIPGIAVMGGNLAAKVYAAATFRLDARHNPDQVTGAPTDLSANALPVQNGSTAGSDTNDALFLPAPSTYSVTRYVYLVGTPEVQVANAAALQITGDIDIRSSVALPSWSAGVDDRILSKLTTSGQFGYRLRFTSGQLQFQWSPNGTAVQTVGVVPTGLVAGQRYFFRVTLDVNNGAGGHDVRFFRSDVQNPALSDWTQIGATVTTAGVTSIFAGTDFVFGAFTGALFGWGVWNGIEGAGGSPVLDWDASRDPVTATHSSFTASTGQTVAVNRAASGRKTEVVEIPGWMFGTDDYAEVADNPLLDFAASQPFTMLAVFRLHDPALGQGIVVKRDSTLNDIGYGLTQTRTLTGTGSSQPVSGLLSPTAGALTVLAGGRDASNNIWRRLNNVASTGDSATAADLTNAKVLRISGYSNGVSPLDGVLHAVYIWRRALSASELSAIAADWGIT